jgi:hypothetical protein
LIFQARLEISQIPFPVSPRISHPTFTARASRIRQSLIPLTFPRDVLVVPSRSRAFVADKIAKFSLGQNERHRAHTYQSARRRGFPCVVPPAVFSNHDDGRRRVVVVVAAAAVTTAAARVRRREVPATSSHRRLINQSTRATVCAVRRTRFPPSATPAFLCTKIVFIRRVVNGEMIHTQGRERGGGRNDDDERKNGKNDQKRDAISRSRVICVNCTQYTKNDKNISP